MSVKIGITGAAGFVGVNLALAAESAGYEVTLYDVGDRMGRLSATGLAQRVRCRFADLSAPEAAVDSDLDVIVHLAALPQVDFSLYHPELVAVNNVASTVAVLGAARKSGIPVLFSSSIEVYGGNDGALFDEDSRLIPLSAYAASKIACENLVGSYQNSYGTSSTTVRLTNLYGPWQLPDRIVPRVAVQSLLGIRSEAVTGRLRDFMHVSDAVSAILKLIELGSWGNVFNISTGEGVGLEGVVSTVVGSNDFSTVSPPIVDGRGASLVATSQRLSDSVGWKPEKHFLSGVQETVDWYGSHRSWWERFEQLVRADRSGPEFLADHMFPIGEKA
ncbi:NAD-dependent epimerase/dehydratase family protein [Kitasatospora sp. NPDC056138]|uniref:NAD-dependent epimerase/dehydratase family protein n=1 Tax=Kitasatospora sp. NPDC056138 TaxID=3345724 RepID=UPI0035DC5E08